MIIINSQRDILFLRKKGSVDPVIVQYIEQHFDMLIRLYGKRHMPPTFSLDNGGSIVFLEKPSDCDRLDSIGLYTSYKNTFPEITELINLPSHGKRVSLFKSTIVISNEKAIDVISEKGTLDSETEQFLKSECTK